MLCVLIDKLLKTQIVECSAVATWIFSKEMTNDFTKMYLWEILHLTIKKMNKHVIKLGKWFKYKVWEIQYIDFIPSQGTELSEAKDKLSRVESSSSDSEDEGTNKRKKIEVGEKPSEELVEKMEEKLEAANVDQKRLFLIVFQRFIMILSEHLVRCDTDGQDFDTDWYRWTIGRLQQVFLLVCSIKKCNVLVMKKKENFQMKISHLFYSIMSKFKSTAAHWRLCSSRPI